MKVKKPLTIKQNEILISISIISFIVGFLFLYSYTLPNEKIIKYTSMSNYLNYYYLNAHTVFNYFNGLWVLFMGIFIICIMILLEIPEIKIIKK